MAKDAYPIRDVLREWFSSANKVVVAGIGNPIRRDDFVGMKIIQDLKGKTPANVCLIECETVPESFIQDIVDFEPSHVLLIDAAFLGLQPGEARLVFPEHVAAFPAVTTHVLPLRIFCEYIEKMTAAKIALLLIEPENTEFGEGLTPTVQATAEEIAKILLELFLA
ncbi:MAG: hydrogenase 3 maturation endopeptidase HyCI [Candidatus Bathyarchaeales archaeon]